MDRMNNHNIKELYGPVDQATAQSLFDLVTSTEFPWYYLPDTTYENARKPSIPTPAWAHLLFGNDGTRSPYLDRFTPVLEGTLAKANLKLNSVIRMRLGFLSNTRYNYPSEPYYYNEPHQDCDFPHYTAVWYMNETDGATIIFSNKEKPEDGKFSRLWESQPDFNKVLLFDGLHYHSSTCPKNRSVRIALTMNFTAEPE
jgi:hypothetical protein